MGQDLTLKAIEYQKIIRPLFGQGINHRFLKFMRFFEKSDNPDLSKNRKI
jgi:hypothetical protein